MKLDHCNEQAWYRSHPNCVLEIGQLQEELSNTAEMKGLAKLTLTPGFLILVVGPKDKVSPENAVTKDLVAGGFKYVLFSPLPTYHPIWLIGHFIGAFPY